MMVKIIFIYVNFKHIYEIGRHIVEIITENIIILFKGKPYQNSVKGILKFESEC
jgi:hypothetical protein